MILKNMMSEEYIMYIPVFEYTMNELISFSDFNENKCYRNNLD